MAAAPPSFARTAATRGILPEGIVWDATAQHVSWVDIELGLLHRGDIVDGIVRARSVWELPDQLGCALPAAGGGWVCGLGRALAVVSPLGVVEEVGPALLRPSERFNDGHIDADGRLVIGTLDSDGDTGHQLLLRLEHDGALTTLSDEIGLSNGIAWSPDGRWLYHADTAHRVITRRAYGDDVGPAEDFADIDGMPDGICVDATGDLWVTVFDAGRLDRFAPDGRRRDDASIVLPSAHVTSVAFGGAHLDTLLVTTGMPIMREWLRRRRPEDGWLFSAPASVRGLPTTPWRRAPLPIRRAG